MPGMELVARDATDPLSKPRASVARTIADLQSFEGTAGSSEMRAVTTAIDWLGLVYSILEPSPETNPAWSGE